MTEQRNIYLFIFNNLFYLKYLQQEPGNGVEIFNAIKYVRPGGGFEANFPIMKKIDVNGVNEHPLYTYMKVTHSLLFLKH